jgi:glycosyltransferase involved in cell wall biosynthesis
VAEWCIKGGNKYIVAMSKNGEQLLLEAGVPRDRLTYIPHAIDRSIWNADVQPVRNLLRVPETAHLTIITAMNKGKRKSFPEMLIAWVRLAQTHEDAYLYLHTDKWGHMDGINLIPLLKALNAPEDRIRWVNSVQMRAGVPAEMVASLMRSADVLLLASRSEGFGLPVIEAQSVGTPVVVTDHTAQPELVRERSTSPCSQTMQTPRAERSTAPHWPQPSTNTTQTRSTQRSGSRCSSPSSQARSD